MFRAFEFSHNAFTIYNWFSSEYSVKSMINVIRTLGIALGVGPKCDCLINTF